MARGGMVWVNGRDLYSLGLVVSDAPGTLDAPAITVPTVQVPGLAGAVRLGALPSSSARLLTIEGTIAADTRGEWEAARDALVEWLSRGLLDVRTAHAPDRRWWCVATDQSVTPAGARFRPGRGGAAVTVTLQATDPCAESLAVASYGLTTAALAIPHGTAPVRPRVTVYPGVDGEGVTGLAVVVTDSRGATVQTVTIGGTIAANDAVILDGPTQRVRLLTAGVESSGSGLSVTGGFPELHPEDGARIHLTASSGTPAGVCDVRARFR